MIDPKPYFKFDPNQYTDHDRTKLEADLIAGGWLPIPIPGYVQPPTMQTTEFFPGDLRDWMAGMALQGILACPSFVKGLDDAALKAGVAFKTAVAQHSFEMADAMLLARETKEAK